VKIVPNYHSLTPLQVMYYRTRQFGVMRLPTAAVNEAVADE